MKIGVDIYRVLRSKRGASLLSAVVGGVIITISVALSMVAQSSATKSEEHFRQAYLARLYAVELLEAFRSFNTQTKFLAYAKANWGANQFCDALNILNRDDGLKANASTLLDLPTTKLSNIDDKLNANRYVKFSVVDMTTKEVKTAPYCTQSINGLGILAANERIVVEVHLTWVPPGKTAAEARSVDVSSVIPGG